MDALIESLYSLPLLLTAVVVRYRLPARILEKKYGSALTFFIMLTANFLAGLLNMLFSIATSIGTDALYYGAVNLILCHLLFKGHIVKKVFLTVLIACGLPIPSYILISVLHLILSPTSEAFIPALTVVAYATAILGAVCMEYVGRRFQNLSRELPSDYTVYLTLVILFVHMAVYSSYERMLLANRYILSPLDALMVIAFALVGVAVVWIAVFAVDRQVYLSLKEQLYAIQTESIKSRELEWRRFAGFRHDIKNHLICLSGLLENGKTEQATVYMRRLTDTVKAFDSPIETGNDYADAVLHAKYIEAMAAKIRVTIDMAIPSEAFLDPVDLCCILSNAFDNAIAACKSLASKERWITANSFIKQGQFVIVIKNSKPPHVTVVDGRVFPREVTADHGLGLDTVKTVVEKYGGALNLSAEREFSFSVLFPGNRL